MDTLNSAGLLGSPLGFFLALALGFCLGLVFVRSGLAEARRMAGLFRLKDLSLLKVLLTAGLTAGVGLTAAQRLGLVGLEDLGAQPTMLLAQALGGLIFGAGLALSGWFPGAALAGLGAGRISALIYLVAALAGTIIYGEVQGFLAPATGFGSLGLRTLYYTLGLSQEILVPALAGVLALWLCEMFERGPLLARPGVNRFFVVGLGLALLGAALGAVRLPQVDVAVMVQTPAQARPSQEQEPSLAGPMAPADLAARLMAGDQNLTVVDLRSPGEFAAFHLKGAINAQAGDLPKTLAWRKNKGSIVLYSEDEVTAGRAAMILAGQGFANVSPLAGGLEGFFRDCLMPASLRDGPVSAQEAQAVKARRNFFLPVELASPPAPAWVVDLPPGLTPPGLAEPAWLKANLGKPGLKVIDLRPQPQYNSGHIPGAFSLQPENLRTNLAGLPSMLMPGPMLAGVFGHMGLGPRDLAVLTYGDNPADATLAGLALERLGHGRYLILNGGMKAWEAQGLPKDTLLPQAQAVNYPAPAGPDAFTVDGPRVLLASADRQTVIIDSRPAEYYSGTKSEEARAGHIPGAVNRPFTEDLAKGPGDSVVLKPVSELAQAYAGLIKSKDSPVIVHCRTGHLASQTWWVLTRLLGYTNVKYYDAGWSEWAARPQWPVALKEDKP